MRRYLACLFSIALALTPLAAAHADDQHSPEDILTDAKAAYWSAVADRTDSKIDIILDQRAHQLKNIPAQEDITLTTTLTLGTQQGATTTPTPIQATLHAAYSIDLATLRTLPDTTTVATALQKLNGSAHVSLSLNDISTLTKSTAPTSVDIAAEGILTNGILYLHLSRAALTGLPDMDAATQADLQKIIDLGWLQFPLSQKLQSSAPELATMTLADLKSGVKKDLLGTDGASMIQGFFATLEGPDATMRLAIKTLLRQYLTEVWANTQLTSYIQGDATGAQLTFGPDDARRILAAHVAFLQNHYTTVIAAGRALQPLNPTLIQAPADITSLDDALTAWQNTTASKIPDFTPLTLAVSFDGNTVTEVDMEHVWQKQQHIPCPRSTTSCPPSTLQNIYANIHYYLKGSYDPYAHALDATFKTRAEDEDQPSILSLKEFPVDSSGTAHLTSSLNAYDTHRHGHTFLLHTPLPGTRL